MDDAKRCIDHLHINEHGRSGGGGLNYCDDILCTQPDITHLGDCTICLLPLPLDINKYVAMSSDVVLEDCDYVDKHSVLSALPASEAFNSGRSRLE